MKIRRITIKENEHFDLKEGEHIVRLESELPSYNDVMHYVLWVVTPT